MNNGDDTKLLDDLATEKLGHYVYALIDPFSGYPFYIGKGGGKKGAGNCRIVEHFEEARNDEGKRSDKVKMIREIWDKSKDVPWKIVRSGLSSEQEAFVVECALIDMLREMNIILTNDQSGHGSAESGIMTKEDLRAWCAPLIGTTEFPRDVLKRPIFIFNIAKGVALRRNKFQRNSEQLFEEATCQFWKVTQENRLLRDAIAIGCINGISRVALNITGWKPEKDRWEIIPDVSSTGKQHCAVLQFLNVSPVINHCLGYWQRGNYLIIRLEGHKQVTVVRGNRSNRSFSL
ncbi:MAG: LEM-3-like GIY-YIG domain-containing protein [Rhizobiaceae bacterium]